jgi:DNA polymerase gamma 1
MLQSQYTKENRSTSQMVGRIFGQISIEPLTLALVVRNLAGVQLLSRGLHAQLFRNVKVSAQDPFACTLSLQHLKQHGLDPKKGQELENFTFTLPPLEAPTLDAHFYAIGSKIAKISLSQAESFASNALPPKPKTWGTTPGWTRYSTDGTLASVPYPDEQLLCFDVETMPPYHNYAILACAASPSAWYCWISPWLLDTSADKAQLVPLGPPETPRIVVGHNVAYDRARVKEEYDVRRTETKWVDTMALHVAVKGISSNQRPAWNKRAKLKNQARMENKEMVYDLLSFLEDELEVEMDTVRRAELESQLRDVEECLPDLLLLPTPTGFEDDGEANVKRWEDITSINSLADVARLYCKVELEKDVRNAFMTEPPEHIAAEIEKYIDYCAKDVEVTHAVFRAVFPLFRQICPHPVSWAGVMAMGNPLLPVNQEWEQYLKRAEGKYRELEEKVKSKLIELAAEAKGMFESGDWKEDVWLSQMDWTPKVAGKSRGFHVPTKKELMAHNGEKPTTSRKKPSKSKDVRVEMRTAPRWRKDIEVLTEFDEHALSHTLPLLLNLKYEGSQMFWCESHGCWLYRTRAPGDAEIIEPRESDGLAEFAKLRAVFVKIPWPQYAADKPLLGKGVTEKLIKDGTLTTEYEELTLELGSGIKKRMAAQGIRDQLMEIAEGVTARYMSARTISMKQLDWEMVEYPVEVVGAPEPNLETTFQPGASTPPAPPPAAPLPPSPTWPKWYWDLAKPREGAPRGSIDITVRNRLAPLLLRLGWLGHPLFHSRQHGWLFRVSPDSEFITRQPPLEFIHKDDSELGDQSVGLGYKFYKLPHKDGEEANVGNPLAKTFIKFAQDGTLSGPSEITKEALDMNAQCSYWISARDRITKQMVVWEKQSGQLGLGNSLNPDEEQQSEKWGIILPQVITMGTVTRRAIEKTWLTASNAKTNRVGSELKAMVRAPPGYAIVGADVDSEELWISSVMGDAQFGMHGATAVGWMTLEGTKKDGTDLHSKTASILDISRDQAKVFNYSRIYGAGMRHAMLLLQQGNAKMTAAQAQKKAEELYASTKGKNTHRTDYFGRKFWYGGSESFLFNKLEEIARSDAPRTPALGCGVTSALSKKHLPREFGSDFLPSRINWVVQSSGVDYLHLLIVSMEHLIAEYDLQARYMISVHDEVRYLVKDEDKYRLTLALQIANLWTRSLFAYRLGLDDLPMSVGFFSGVDVDFVLRKEVDMACVTPSQTEPLDKGECLTIKDSIVKTNGGSLHRDGSEMERWVDRLSEPESPAGYVEPDVSKHRADGPLFLAAQSARELNYIKMQAEKLKNPTNRTSIAYGRFSTATTWPRYHPVTFER